MRTTRWCVAVLTVIGTVLLTASSALASTGPIQYSKDISGYQATGRWFRYVSTTFTLPTNSQCQRMATISPAGFGAAVTLGPAEESNLGVPLSAGPASTLGVSMVPSATGCGLISPSFASNLPGYSGAQQFPAGAITLSPANAVRIDLYYRQADQLTIATIYNLTTGKQAQASLQDPAVYMVASATGGFGTVTAPPGSFRVWGFTNSAATTYTGTRGTMTGPWTTSPIVLTATGTQGRALVSPFLWGGGAGFGVWAR